MILPQRWYMFLTIALLAGDLSQGVCQQKSQRTDFAVASSKCCVAASAPADSSWMSATVPFSIYLQFEKEAPSGVVAAMEKEAESVLAPLGLPVEWRRLDHNYEKTSVVLLVTTFQGECDPASSSPVALGRAPLGFTHISDGEILPFAEVDCNRIRGAIQGKLSSAYPSLRPSLLGRAAGRVLGHEIYHILAQTRQHASRGLANSFLSGDDLTSGNVHFFPEEIRGMRANTSNARQLLELSRGAKCGSATAGRYIYEENRCASCHGSRGQGTRKAPALRVEGKGMEFETLAERLTRHLSLSTASAVARYRPPALDEDEMEDLFSFLNERE